MKSINETNRSFIRNMRENIIKLKIVGEDRAMLDMILARLNRKYRLNPDTTDFDFLGRFYKKLLSLQDGYMYGRGKYKHRFRRGTCIFTGLESLSSNLFVRGYKHPKTEPNCLLTREWVLQMIEHLVTLLKAHGWGYDDPKNITNKDFIRFFENVMRFFVVTVGRKCLGTLHEFVKPIINYINDNLADGNPFLIIKCKNKDIHECGRAINCHEEFPNKNICIVYNNMTGTADPDYEYYTNLVKTKSIEQSGSGKSISKIFSPDDKKNYSIYGKNGIRILKKYVKSFLRSI